MNTLEIGDTVRLNSGGPRMVVIETRTTRVFCSWMNHINEIQTSNFPIECLTIVITPPIPMRVKQPHNLDGTEFRVGQSAESWRTRNLWRLKRDLESLNDKN